jgi:hypothetical protein
MTDMSDRRAKWYWERRHANRSRVDPLRHESGIRASPEGPYAYSTGGRGNKFFQNPFRNSIGMKGETPRFNR